MDGLPSSSASSHGGIGHARHIVGVVAWPCVSHPALCVSRPARRGRLRCSGVDALPS